MNLYAGDIIRCHRVKVESYRDNIQLVGNPKKGCAFVTFHRKVNPVTGFQRELTSNNKNSGRREELNEDDDDDDDDDDYMDIDEDIDNNENVNEKKGYVKRSNDNTVLGTTFRNVQSFSSSSSSSLVSSLQRTRNKAEHHSSENFNYENNSRCERDLELDSELCHLSHGSNHPGLSTHDWEVRHTSKEFTFDKIKDTEIINKLSAYAVFLFLKYPLGDIIKSTITLNELLEKVEFNKEKEKEYESISATSVYAMNEELSNNIPKKILISVGVGDDVACSDLLYRVDRADILCMVAGVVSHDSHSLDCHSISGLFLPFRFHEFVV